MKNVAIITQSLNSGGAERMAANMSLMLEKRYNVILITFSDKNVNYAYGGKLVTYKNANKRLNPVSHFFSIVRRIRETKKIKKEYGIDVSISHQDRPNIINVLGGIGDKRICCLHTSPTSVMTKHSRRAIAQKYVCRHSYKYVTVSKVAEDDLVSFYKYPSDKVTCVYNFCDIGYIREKSKENPPDEANSFILAHQYIVAFSGRLIRSKGYDHLFRAVKKLLDKGIDVGLIALGDGEMRKESEELVSKLNMSSNVFFCGYVDNPFCYLSKADLFVMPSEYEGLPMVIIEAAACGCPIISTDIVSGPREILAPGTDIRFHTKEIEYAEYGVLVPDCSGSDFGSLEITPEESVMVDAIMELLCNEDVRERYVSQSAVLAKRFDKEALLGEWIKLIEEQ